MQSIAFTCSTNAFMEQSISKSISATCTVPVINYMLDFMMQQNVPFLVLCRSCYHNLNIYIVYAFTVPFLAFSVHVHVDIPGVLCLILNAYVTLQTNITCSDPTIGSTLCSCSGSPCQCSCTCPSGTVPPLCEPKPLVVSLCSWILLISIHFAFEFVLYTSVTVHINLCLFHYVVDVALCPAMCHTHCSNGNLFRT